MFDKIATSYEDARFMMRCLRYRFRTERLQLKTLARLNLRGATVLDIGANKGIYSFWLSRAVGPEGSVLSFEPQPEMVSYINARRLGWDNVRTLNVALSNAGGSAKLSRKRIGDGSASLSRQIGETISVPLAKLDEFPISDLKFIKCDVEGHEHEVFIGGESMIRRFRPIIQFEATAPDNQTLFSFFERMGYSGVLFLGNEYLPYANPKRKPHYKFGLEGHRDFLFFPPEAIGSIIPTDVSSKFP